MIVDKKQLIGGGVLVVALIGVSIATGKLDIKKFTGQADDSGPTFQRRLPPPVKEHAEVQPGAATSVPADDVLASVAGETASSSVFVNELAGGAPGAAAGDAQTPPDFGGAPGGPRSADPPEASNAQAPPAVSVGDARAIPGEPASASPPAAQVAQPLPLPEARGATVNAATLVPPSPPASAPGAALAAPVPAPMLPPPSAPLVPPGSTAPPTPAGAVVPMAGVLAGGDKGISIPGASVVASTAAPSPSSGAGPLAPESATEPSGNASATIITGNSVAAAAMASLPTNATGQDLLALQTQLAVLEKQKAIASGQEAIAESLLKTRKAQFEMTQIGRPSAAQVAAQQVAQPRAPAAPPPPPPSPLASVRLLSTARANGSIGATISYNGKLIDVKKGSVVAGYLVDKVTDTSLVFIGDRETKTVWID